MKLLVNVPNCNELNLAPRDIRNYVGSIVDERFEDKVMRHKMDLPQVIYPKTYKGGFEIVSYSNDVELMQHVKNKIDSHRNFFGQEIKNARFINEQYEIPQKQETSYITRTPVIIAVNLFEFKAVAGKITDSFFANYINIRIKNDVRYQIKKIYGIDFDFDLKTAVMDIKRISIQYKDIKLPAITMKFYSNYTLPRFMGYKIGLGWGEIINCEEIKERETH